jgi:hypothetical protein
MFSGLGRRVELLLDADVTKDRVTKLIRSALCVFAYVRPVLCAFVASYFGNRRLAN